MNRLILKQMFLVGLVGLPIVDSLADDPLSSRRNTRQVTTQDEPVPLAPSQLTDSQVAADQIAGGEVPPAPAPDSADDLDTLLDLAESRVQDLSQVRVAAPSLQTEVSTVSRQVSTIGRSPAAVFVITNEMIRRSGARSIPEVLRMAPGVEVAKIDASKWAISIRGSNSRFANKLLVQIDGRTVYTPLFGGVFWDVQDVLLEDVERIEVIRGPGASVWGANAVNGIINILTKQSSGTQGAFAEGGAGSEERHFASARYGGQLGENATYRVYGKWFDRGPGYSPVGNAHDDWHMGRGGFRMDWAATECDSVTIQGDAYGGKAGQRNVYPNLAALNGVRVVDEDVQLAGGNGLLRWTHSLGEKSDWTAQAYYDRTERASPLAPFREDRNTVDFDFQHRFPWNDWNAVIWGFGYRNTADFMRGGLPITFPISRRADDLFSYFLQDELTLHEELWYLTLGCKFQHNDYTNYEYQPTARLLWTPSERHSVWWSVSRAVRTPSRAESDMILTSSPAVTVPFPIFPQLNGNRGVVAEDLLAFETGIRVQPTDRFSWDLAAFLYDYNDLVGLAPGPLVFPFATQTVVSAGDGQAWGGEIACNYQFTECWRLHGNYSLFRFWEDDGVGLGGAPRNQAYLQSSWDLGNNVEFDAIWRYVDIIPSQRISAYNVMDLRLAWYPNANWELSCVGRNLLDSRHPEFGDDAYIGTLATEVQREVYGMATLRY